MAQKGYRYVSFTSVVSDLLFSSLENNNSLPFLDVLLTKMDPALFTEVYRKLTHTDCYVHSESSHPPHAEMVVNSLLSRAATICQELHDFLDDIEKFNVIWHSMIILSIS
jgi:hypothetical protein